MEKGSKSGEDLLGIKIEFHCCSWFCYILVVAEEIGKVKFKKPHNDGNYRGSGLCILLFSLTFLDY